MSTFRQTVSLSAAFFLGFLCAGAVAVWFVTHAPPAEDGTAPTPASFAPRLPDPGERIWQMAPGFQVAPDADGFMGPVAIVFLNHPGSEPDSPLYLVTELRGTIKVVRRDRSIGVFGEVPDKYLAPTLLPKESASYGLHGACIDAQDRTLYTTGVYGDGDHAFNRISVWESAGEVPWEKGRVVGELRQPFADVPVSRGHSIGNCLIGADGKLWVGIGDGDRPRDSHDPRSSAGKILRLNPDLTAPADNPFFDPRNPGAIESYVYTMGLRNPWALAEAPGDAIYVGDNGPAMDRLVKAERGHDYPWNGSDESFTFDNLLLWPRPMGPASMAFVGTSEVFPFLENVLVVTSASRTAVVLLPVADGRVRNVSAFVMWRPQPSYSVESLNGVAMGPDGLYVAHMVYDQSEFFRPSPILKITRGSYQGSQMTLHGQDLLRASGCLGCHLYHGEGSQLSPALDGVASRIAGRLEDPAYIARLRQLDRHSSPEVRQLAAVREQLYEGNLERRIFLWMQSKMKTPKFDDPGAEMSAATIGDDRIDSIARFLSINTRR